MNDRIEAVRAAIRNPGSHPEHHMATMERHRREWPVLWAALDALLATPVDQLTKPEVAE